jgi:N-methylhydantoinase B/oxoprolinase/acetone carboxylase alpha subunit
VKIRLKGSFLSAITMGGGGGWKKFKMFQQKGHENFLIWGTCASCENSVKIVFSISNNGGGGFEKKSQNVWQKGHKIF